jgi:hypothetical protein
MASVAEGKEEQGDDGSSSTLAGTGPGSPAASTILFNRIVGNSIRQRSSAMPEDAGTAAGVSAASGIGLGGGGDTLDDFQASWNVVMREDENDTNDN